MASPPKEVQSEPDLDIVNEDGFNLDGCKPSSLPKSKPKVSPSVPLERSLNYDDDEDDAIPEETPLNIIESTIFTFSL